MEILYIWHSQVDSEVLLEDKHPASAAHTTGTDHEHVVQLGFNRSAVRPSQGSAWVKTSVSKLFNYSTRPVHIWLSTRLRDKFL